MTNAQILPLRARTKRNLLLPDVEDRAFLPAALALTETPPSPIRIAIMFAICGFATAALAWAWFGRIDVIATARGKIEPSGHVKVIQPLETGKISELAVKDGQSVKAGDLLVRLDPKEADAVWRAATHAATAADSEARRRAAAIAAVKAGRLLDPAEPAWPESTPTATRAREAEVLRSDLHELSATLANLADQEAEKQAAIGQLTMSIEAESLLEGTLTERVTMRQILVEKAAGTKASLIDATQTLRETQARIAGDTGRRDQANAALASLRSERLRVTDTFLSDQTRKMADARRLADEKEAERDRALAHLDQLTLRAPVDGTIQALAVTTPGQVVTGGQELMRLVPEGAPVEIQAYVSNENIGFVTPDQDAVVKIDSFPFTRFGTIPAKVMTVAHDAIPTDIADQVLGDRARASDRQAQAMTPTARPMTDLVFETRLRPGADTVSVNGHAIALTAGMTVSVEIKTGSRRILEYVFSPVVEVASTAMRER